MTKFFVWVSGLQGPEAQLWIEKPVDGSGKAKPYLACHALPDDDKRGLDKLKEDFKYENVV